jgi:hypothetical protein
MIRAASHMTDRARRGGERTSAAGPRSLRAAFLSLVLVGTSLLAAACGGSASPGVANVGSETTTSTVPAGNSGGPTPPAVTKELLAFSKCVRAHGVPSFPDPTASSGFPNSARNFTGTPQYQAALKACKSLALASGVIHSPAEIAQHLKQLSAEDACFRKHGVPNMPGPTAQGSQTFPPGITPSSPQFQAAAKVCAYLNP